MKECESTSRRWLYNIVNILKTTEYCKVVNFLLRELYINKRYQEKSWKILLCKYTYLIIILSFSNKPIFFFVARPAEVDTVDGFQGRQKDCVIVTCVRANTMQGSIG